ncbi:hypothetical protein B0J13DRAFT_627500 [Dactylonectria estremocensis]|uniref:Uncharacterized protein n=1 Tax=Dactylonectria estremocensis TaxID=1079267 RepID=A0A9P9DYU2_9HYPO|nr:hypothetical protein B0J13DRAFT_627500 [Dactylonectria estremocensis]
MRNTVGTSYGASETPGRPDETANPGSTQTETPNTTRLPTGTPHDTESQSATPRETVDTPTDHLTGSEKPTLTLRVTGTPMDSPAFTSISKSASIETDATRLTGTDVSENTPGTLSVTNAPVGISSTATNPPKTSAAGGEHSSGTQSSTQPTETDGLEAVITGTDDAVVTYAPTRNPDYTSITKVTTTTDDDNNVIVIWPGGWIWVPKGSLPTVIPGPPNTNPDPNDGSGGGAPGDDPEDPDDEPSPSSSKEPASTTSSECTATEPPECTKTASYTWIGTEYSKTIIGTCLPISACVTGRQSTTTEVISPTMVVDERFDWEDASYVPTDEDAGANPDEETVEWFDDFFEDNGMGLVEDDEVIIAPECRGDRSGLDYKCFISLFPTFCLQVNNDEEKELSVNLTNEDGSESKRRFLRTRRLLPRAANCDGSMINFQWTGENHETECAEDCLGSMGQLAASCALAGDQGIYHEGSVDVGCDYFNHDINELNGKADINKTSSYRDASDVIV